MKKIVVSLAAVAVVTLAGCASGSSPTDAMSRDAMTPAMSSDAMAPSDAMSPSDAMTPDAMAPASFVSYEDYQAAKDKYTDSKVVLFFNAKWCPSCQAIVKSLTENPGQIPSKTTVVSVDYDSHTDLRQQYKVTMQHTFVQIDGQGMAQRTWLSTSPEALLKELQG